MLVNADFHIHSCFSMASSKDMLIKNIAPKSKLKGLELKAVVDVNPDSAKRLLGSVKGFANVITLSLIVSFVCGALFMVVYMLLKG